MALVLLPGNNGEKLHQRLKGISCTCTCHNKYMLFLTIALRCFCFKKRKFYDIIKEQTMQELNVNEIDEVAGGLLPEGSVGGNSNW